MTLNTQNTLLTKLHMSVDSQLHAACHDGNLELTKTFVGKNVNWDYGLVGATTPQLQASPDVQENSVESQEVKVEQENALTMDQKACAEFCVSQGASPYWLLTSKDHPRGRAKAGKLNFMGHNISVKACDYGGKCTSSVL